MVYKHIGNVPVDSCNLLKDCDKMLLGVVSGDYAFLTGFKAKVLLYRYYCCMMVNRQYAEVVTVIFGFPIQ